MNKKNIDIIDPIIIYIVSNNIVYIHIHIYINFVKRKCVWGRKKIKMTSVVSSTNSQNGPTTDTTNKLPIILIVGKSIENINKITNALKTHHFQMVASVPWTSI